MDGRADASHAAAFVNTKVSGLFAHRHVLFVDIGEAYRVDMGRHPL